MVAGGVCYESDFGRSGKGLCRVEGWSLGIVGGRVGEFGMLMSKIGVPQ
jgi:hypothetical protein